MLKEKVVVIGYDDTTSLSTLLNQLKQTANFTYHIVSATMVAALINIVHAMKADMIILCYRNNQYALNELKSSAIPALTPILCLSSRFEYENLTWHQQQIVFNFSLAQVYHHSHLSSTIDSILLMGNKETAVQKNTSLADAAISGAATDHTRNLSRYVMELDQKVEVLLKIKERIGELYPNVDDQTRASLISIVNSIKISANDHKLWDDFKLYFEQINPGFLTQLTKAYPSLTSIDLKYCCYLKMNMSNDDIRNLLGINQESVRTHKYRLKKKMALTRDQDLLTHLRAVDHHKLNKVAY